MAPYQEGFNSQIGPINQSGIPFPLALNAYHDQRQNQATNFNQPPCVQGMSNPPWWQSNQGPGQAPSLHNVQIHNHGMNYNSHMHQPNVVHPQQMPNGPYSAVAPTSFSRDFAHPDNGFNTNFTQQSNYGGIPCLSDSHSSLPSVLGGPPRLGPPPRPPIWSHPEERRLGPQLEHHACHSTEPHQNYQYWTDPGRRALLLCNQRNRRPWRSSRGSEYHRQVTETQNQACGVADITAGNLNRGVCIEKRQRSVTVSSVKEKKLSLIGIDSVAKSDSPIRKIHAKEQNDTRPHKRLCQEQEPADLIDLHTYKLSQDCVPSQMPVIGSKPSMDSELKPQKPSDSSDKMPHRGLEPILTSPSLKGQTTMMACPQPVHCSTSQLPQKVTPAESSNDAGSTKRGSAITPSLCASLQMSPMSSNLPLSSLKAAVSPLKEPGPCNTAPIGDLVSCFLSAFLWQNQIAIFCLWVWVDRAVKELGTKGTRQCNWAHWSHPSIIC